jgi:hypothetical protein
VQSSAKATGRFPNAAASGATKGRNEKAGSGPPFGRPKCDMTTTLARLATSSRIVGASRAMRVASLTRPSCIGTLRSARSKTRFAETSRSSSVRNSACAIHQSNSLGDRSVETRAAPAFLL